jgi:hypothetical protein
MSRMRNINKESGLVSILTVIFFIIFISILIVGFIKITTDEARQATDNDLSASALASAQSGVEDAKRIISYCIDPASGASGHTAACNAILNSGSNADPCDIFVGMASGMNGLRNVLGIERDSLDNKIVVGELDERFKQYYTCLTIQKNTDDLVIDLTEGRSQVTPLTLTAGDLTSLEVEWFNGGRYATRPGLTGITFALPTYSLWKYPSTALGTKMPPMLRLQFIPYTPGAVNLEASETGSRTVFLTPVQDTFGTSSVVITGADDRQLAPQGQPRVGSAPVSYADCKVVINYLCDIQLTGFAPGVRYYLRSTVLYGSETTMLLKANNGTGIFDGVSPRVDVTGVANDVYRRIVSRVMFRVPLTPYPEYALESETDICKRLVVADTANSRYYCP